MDRDELKRMAAEHAVDAIRPGMVVGLGHGSTARFALLRLAEKIRSGELRGVRAIPCSGQVAAEARQAGIPLLRLEDTDSVDLTIDGADEVDPDLNLIKGGGGALVREKIVAQASRREIIVVDEAKLSERLGTKFPLPVEVTAFGWSHEARHVRELGARVTLRLQADGSPYMTDQGNYILDCDFGPIADVRGLASRLDARGGVMGHGLFVGLADTVIVGAPTGVQVRTRREEHAKYS